MSSGAASRLQFGWLRHPKAKDVEDINRLLIEHLSPQSPGTRLDLIRAMVKARTSIGCYRDTNGTIQGVGVLVQARDFYGLFGIIESVVVHPSFQKQGYGRCLMEELIQWAHNHDYQRIQLTSKPERLGANKLYQSLGFTRIETNVYRLQLHST